MNENQTPGVLAAQAQFLLEMLVEVCADYERNLSAAQPAEHDLNDVRDVIAMFQEMRAQTARREGLGAIVIADARQLTKQLRGVRYRLVIEPKGGSDGRAETNEAAEGD